MEKITLKEWLKRGKELYGEDYSKWKFVCPACGHISKGEDFKAFGADINDAYVECIGRVNGKAESGLNFKEGDDNSNGCDWAAYGLFGTLGNGIIVINEDNNNKEVEVFKFADDI